MQKMMYPIIVPLRSEFRHYVCISFTVTWGLLKYKIFFSSLNFKEVTSASYEKL